MGLPIVSAIVVVLLAGTAVRPAAAQDTASFRSPRGDATGLIGWFGANKSELDGYEDWYKRVWHGSVAAGYYWTEHLKTEVEFGATSQGDLYEVPSPADVVRGVFPGVVEHEFSTKRLALAQHYQFFHNTWFHPSIGGGLALTWETTTRHLPPIFAQDPSGPGGRTTPPRILAPERTEGPETDLRTMAFASTGFKAYFTPRGFFRTDLRVTFADRVEDVTVRFGFGTDW